MVAGLALLRAATDRLAEKAGGGESNVRVSVAVARVAEGRRRRRRRRERRRGTGGVSDRLVHVASTTRTRLGRAASGRTSQQRASPMPDTRAQPPATRPPAAHPLREQARAASGGVGRDPSNCGRVRAGDGRQRRVRWCAQASGVGAGVGAVLGAARAARGLSAEAPAAARWMGHASRGRRGTGQRRTSRPRPRANLRGGSPKEFKRQNSLSQHTGSTQVRTGAC